MAVTDANRSETRPPSLTPSQGREHSRGPNHGRVEKPLPRKQNAQNVMRGLREAAKAATTASGRNLGTQQHQARSNGDLAPVPPADTDGMMPDQRSHQDTPTMQKDTSIQETGVHTSYQQGVQNSSSNPTPVHHQSVMSRHGISSPLNTQQFGSTSLQNFPAVPLHFHQGQGGWPSFAGIPTTNSAQPAPMNLQADPHSVSLNWPAPSTLTPESSSAALSHAISEALEKAIRKSTIIIALQNGVEQVKVILQSIEETVHATQQSGDISLRVLQDFQRKVVELIENLGTAGNVELSVLHQRAGSSATRLRGKDRPGAETERSKLVRGLSCSSQETGCTMVNGVRLCPVPGTMARIFLDRPAGIRSGTHFGAASSELLRRAACFADYFYPTSQVLYSALVFEALKNANCPPTDEQKAHLDNIYKVNKAELDGMFHVAHRNTHNSRRKDVVTEFEKVLWTTGKTVTSCFDSAAAIDAGTFRSNSQSAVDDPRFVAAVKKSFQVEDRGVSLSMIAFASITLIRNYTARNVRPTLFKLVPGGALSQVQYEEYSAMHGLTCAALARRLDAQSDSTRFEHVCKTANGWNTASFDITQLESPGSNWLDGFQTQLGTNVM